MNRHLLTYSFILSFVLVNAGTYTTTAVVGTWAEGGSPGQNDNIVVNHDWSSQNSGLGNPLSTCKGTITINSGGYYKVWGALTVQGGGSILLSAGGTMEVSGSLDINGAAGTITLNGSFITIGATVNGANITGAGTWTWSGSFTNNGSINGYTDDPTISPLVLTTLPVQLISFSAQLSENKRTMLHWQTSSEINNSRFVIERSNDKLNFKEIGELSGKGNSNQLENYYFEDLQSTNELCYYRLKQVDFDGQFSYSKVVEFKSENNALSKFQIHENNIAIDNVNAKFITWKFIAINGVQMLSENIEVINNHSSISIPFLNDGMYLVMANFGKESICMKILIETKQ